MRTITLPRADYAHGRLLADLIAAAPDLAPVNDDGMRVARYSMRVTDRSIEFAYPEDVSEKIIRAVIAAHNRHAPEPEPASATAVRAIENARTLDDLKAAVLAYFRVGRGVEP